MLSMKANSYHGEDTERGPRGRVVSGKEVVSRKASEVDSDFDRRIGFEPSTDSGKWKRILSRQMRTIQRNGDAGGCGAGMGTSEP